MAKRNEELGKVTGKWLKSCYEWLVKEGEGCCHLVIGTTAKHNVCVCVGWTKVDVDDGPGEPVTVGNCTTETRKSHEEWKVAWKIGWQTFDNVMQTDLDLDFDMPWNTKEFCDRMNAKLSDDERRHGVRFVEGDVYDTEEVVEAHVRTNIYRQRLCGAPRGYRDWNALAAFVRKTARKVLAYAKEVDPEEGKE